MFASTWNAFIIHRHIVGHRDQGVPTPVTLCFSDLVEATRATWAYSFQHGLCDQIVEDTVALSTAATCWVATSWSRAVQVVIRGFPSEKYSLNSDLLVVQTTDLQVLTIAGAHCAILTEIPYNKTLQSE